MLVRPRHLAGLALCALVVVGCADDGSTPVEPAASSRAAGSGSTAASDQAIPDVVEAVQPSVVAILSDLGEGSGVIYDADGVIVTNNHVVEGTSELRVVFADGSRMPAALVATDPTADLAVIRVERDQLPAAEFRVDLPRVGELAIAVGNPLGFENSATAGIVSGLHRGIPGAAQTAPALVDLLQTDAAISPGNSGGALVDGDGRVIGVNVAYIPPSEGAVSLGFAIPAATVTDVVAQLLDTGRAEHVFLGVQPAPITDQVVQQFDLDVQEGVLVADVVPGSAAERAGLVPGDVIVEVDGETVNTVEDFLGYLRRADPGDEMELTVVRDGERLEVRAVLGERTA